MLTVQTFIQQSSIEGLGLFAAQAIPKGTVVWKFDPRFDLAFDPVGVAQMAEIQRDLIEKYAYLSSTSGNYIYSIDDSRFTNHSSLHNNIEMVRVDDEPETRAVANRDIAMGEEILENYRDFDANDETSSEEYLSS
jgi:SET domain-containing protein